MSKALVLLVFFSIVALSVSATLVSYWDFNSNAPGSGVNWAQPISSSTSNGSLAYTYPQLRAATGDTLNSIDSVFGSSLHVLISDNLSYHNNKYLDLTLSTVGFHNISMSFASTRSSGAFSSATVSYSTDDVTFTPQSTLSFTNTSWQLFTVDFSNVTAVEDVSFLKIRILTTGATQVSRYFRYDNIKITGDPITLPVELTGFAVSPGVNNNANVTWITQSETGVNGFYVLRGCSDMLSEAVIISPLISASNTSTTQSYYYEDTDIPAAGSYYYWLQSLDFNGEISYFGPQLLSWNPGEPGNIAPPLANALSSVYPNPFNPSTTIAYALQEALPVQIVIYNLRGQAVHSINLGRKIAGEHKYIWNGKSDWGEACPSGVYRIVLHAGKVIDNRKVLLLK